MIRARLGDMVLLHQPGLQLTEPYAAIVVAVYSEPLTADLAVFTPHGVVNGHYGVSHQSVAPASPYEYWTYRPDPEHIEEESADADTPDDA